jgi:hypothetical protein
MPRIFRPKATVEESLGDQQQVEVAHAPAKKNKKSSKAGKPSSHVSKLGNVLLAKKVKHPTETSVKEIVQPLISTSPAAEAAAILAQFKSPEKKKLSTMAQSNANKSLSDKTNGTLDHLAEISAALEEDQSFSKLSLYDSKYNSDEETGETIRPTGTRKNSIPNESATRAAVSPVRLNANNKSSAGISFPFPRRNVAELDLAVFDFPQSNSPSNEQPLYDRAIGTAIIAAFYPRSPAKKSAKKSKIARAATRRIKQARQYTPAVQKLFRLNHQLPRFPQTDAGEEIYIHQKKAVRGGRMTAKFISWEEDAVDAFDLDRTNNNANNDDNRDNSTAQIEYSRLPGIRKVAVAIPLIKTPVQQFSAITQTQASLSTTKIATAILAMRPPRLKPQHTKPYSDTRKLLSKEKPLTELPQIYSSAEAASFHAAVTSSSNRNNLELDDIEMQSDSPHLADISRIRGRNHFEIDIDDFEPLSEPGKLNSAALKLVRAPPLQYDSIGEENIAKRKPTSLVHAKATRSIFVSNLHTNYQIDEASERLNAQLDEVLATIPSPLLFSKPPVIAANINKCAVLPVNRATTSANINPTPLVGQDSNPTRSIAAIAAQVSPNIPIPVKPAAEVSKYGINAAQWSPATSVHTILPDPIVISNLGVYHVPPISPPLPHFSSYSIISTLPRPTPLVHHR